MCHLDAITHAHFFLASKKKPMSSPSTPSIAPFTNRSGILSERRSIQVQPIPATAHV